MMRKVLTICALMAFALTVSAQDISKIQFCDKNENLEKLESNGLLPEIIKILAKRNEKYIKDKMSS